MYTPSLPPYIYTRRPLPLLCTEEESRQTPALAAVIEKKHCTVPHLRPNLAGRYPDPKRKHQNAQSPNAKMQIKILINKNCPR
jgi:hypothetical protein